jgi:uncharacterized protein YdhG (YjbR/CyaY superfamily)
MAKQSVTVNEFMQTLDHPFKSEVEAIRVIIKGVDRNITEQIKWNAPSFSYKDYLATFNLRATQHVHLVFHNPKITSIKSELLEGDYGDRRMAYFGDMNDVKAKQAELERVIKELVTLMDEEK